MKIELYVHNFETSDPDYVDDLILGNYVHLEKEGTFDWNANYVRQDQEVIYYYCISNYGTFYPISSNYTGDKFLKL